MPDLKKPEDKPDSKQRSFEPHEKDDFTVVKNKKIIRSVSTVYSKSWLAIVCSMMVVFSIMLFLFVKRNKKKINQSQRR